MLKILKTNLKHFLITFFILLTITVGVAVGFGVDINYGDNALAYKLDKEGPHVFFKDDQVSVDYIRGNKTDGFYIQQNVYSQQEEIPAKVYFPLEESEFSININPAISSPASVYDDGNPILAISDVESGYKTFRDFLIANGVIDAQLNWTFGKGHLALVGDFVDRGFSTTQVLWFIYKLEQEAITQGGRVHFILGNHEIKNLQGNFQKAGFKYFYIASIIGKSQTALFDNDSFIGRWMTSKNTIERINGVLFVHGGIHPKLSELNFSLDDINRIVRQNYTLPYFQKTDKPESDWLLSTRTGPSWYRGYFEDDLTERQVESGLDKFTATAVVVGHTPQWKVNQQYHGKVFAIDVKHPKDYRGSFPPRRSEGLLIDGGKFYRVLDDGSKEQL